jgi:Spy/CpxP family protein refolding chaperone
MRRAYPIVLAPLAAALLASALGAQPPGGRFMPFGVGPLMLLAQKPVQDELKLTDEQGKQIREQMRKQRETFGGLQDLAPEERRQKMEEIARANEKFLAEVLEPGQRKRLRQINLQLQGPRAAVNPQVAAGLNLGDEQKKQLRDLQQDAFSEMRKIREESNDPRELRTRMADFTRKMNEQVLKLFTAEQKARWKEMTGEPFKGKLEFPFAGRRQG